MNYRLVQISTKRTQMIILTTNQKSYSKEIKCQEEGLLYHKHSTGLSLGSLVEGLLDALHIKALWGCQLTTHCLFYTSRR